MLDNSPDNALTRPHCLQARLEAARRVLPVRERTLRRVYLALRALEYELNQPLPTLRGNLAAARTAADFAELLACLDSIAEDSPPASSSPPPTRAPHGSRSWLATPTRSPGSR